MISEVHNEDCMIGMARFPDNYFQLSIVDPPYGINFAKTHTGKGWIVRKSKDWDKLPPSKEYFNELQRISKNQIIWGGNYFTEYLRPTMGWIFWDKGQRDFSLADGELSWTSFDKALRVFDYSRAKLNQKREGLHPTEKPVALYKWLLKNYAKEGDKIIDTHLGSQSSRIACWDGGFDFWGWEIDEDYFRDGNKRFEAFKMQQKLDFK